MYFNHKLNSLSRFATLRVISNLFSFFIHPVVFGKCIWLVGPQDYTKCLNKIRCSSSGVPFVMLHFVVLLFVNYLLVPYF